jgi:uncharacterized protein
VSIANKPKLIVAAIASRAYVQAAVAAGFEVLALDVFCDVDTQKLAFETRQINLGDYGFNATELLKILDELDLAQFTGLCYGAGFEAQPQVLVEIAKRLPVLGNSVETLRHSKNPKIFVELCSAYEMLTPKTAFKRPIRTLGWVSKQLGASGGAHIKPLLPLDLPSQLPVYYQKVTDGTPISCLFLADGVHAEVIGFSEQWCASTALSPYRYGGAVSHASLSQHCKKAITAFIQIISFKLGLRGINSIDFLVDDDYVYALEINPRLSATLDLYTAKQGNYFASHIKACQVQLSDWPSVKGVSRAHQIIYTRQAIKTPANMNWPDWVCDIPQPDIDIEAGAPLCTVVAEAHTAHAAKQMVLERAASLRQELMLV